MNRPSPSTPGPAASRGVRLHLVLAPLLVATALAFGFPAHGMADPLVQQGGKVADLEPASAGLFGRGVALSGDGQTAVIGAPRDRETGSASIFVRSGESWARQGTPLTGGEASVGARFGQSTALSADGATALIGAPDNEDGRGAAFVFARSGSSWTQQGAELSGDESTAHGRFGRSVALSADGQTALVGGARSNGGRGYSAWVFVRSGSTWTQQGEALTAGEEGLAVHAGARVALSADGSTALIGASSYEGRQGAVWVFARTGETWAEQAGPLKAAEAGADARFGSSLALSADGSTALIGGADKEGSEGAAWVFTRSGASWAQQGPALTSANPADESLFAFSVALSGAGDLALIGSPRYSGEGSGPTAWVFARSGSSWTRETVGLTGGGETGRARFGDSVALSSDGATALIGGPLDTSGAGAAWFFTGSPALSVPSAPSQQSGTTAAAPSVDTGEAGVGGGARSGVLASQVTGLALPRLGLTANLRPLSGRVLVKLPGSSSFVPLTAAEQVPFGTIIDATHGRVALTTARLHGGTQTMTFFDGEFRISQRRDGLVIATLTGGDFSVCPTASERRQGAITSSSHASRKHVVRKLWAEGHGSYSTKGNYASGAVLGTRWLTEDRCDGTLIHVATDSVRVTNLRTHRHLRLRAGRSYLAKAP